jgi:hypothetical protein
LDYIGIDQTVRTDNPMDAILYWNQVALDAAREDFASPDSTTAPSPEQPGPTYCSRALAIVHLAMYDAYIGVRGGPNTYLTYTSTPGTTDLEAAQAAVAAAACLTLISQFPRQKATFLTRHQEFVAQLPDNDPKISKGLAWGHLVANEMLADRVGDGSEVSNDLYAPSAEPYRHRPDPLNPGQGFLGPNWGDVTPFGFKDLQVSLTPLPDPLTTAGLYLVDFDAVKTLGIKQGSTRTPDNTATGIFWAYDGARNIGLPPRLYNQVVRAIVEAKGGVTETENATLFAMVNVAMADAGIQAWHEKYRHNLWRPVVGIREAEPGWGPTGKGAQGSGDPYWEPLGAPRTNFTGAPAAFTPGFPAYPSGHATFGTAALLVAKKYLQLTNTFTFGFVSDEFNGISVGEQGVRPHHKRTMTIDDAIEDNILSRVYLGVHWEFDGRAGETLGTEIANAIVSSFPSKV